MALALPRWIRAFDWPTLALIRERPNTRVSLRLRRNTLTAPTPPRGGTYLSKSSPPMYYPAPTRVRLHCSARTSPRAQNGWRPSTTSVYSWARRAASSLPCPPPPLTSHLLSHSVCRLSWELEQGLKLKKEPVFFLISDKFVTDFPYCQVFDRQFFVLNVKQIRKSTISFGLLIQMEGKF